MRPIYGVLRSLGAAGLLVGLTFSCGNDTKTDPDEDDGSGGTGGNTANTANSGGNGGTAGTGGTGGSAGSNTTSGTTSGSGGLASTMTTTTATTTGAAGAGELPETTPGLAEPCGSDDDCESDLICLAADSNSLIVGGPANGLCTSPCDADNLCNLDAACITFDGVGYCMPMCIPNNGVHDCAERSDVVCDVLPVGVSCDDNADCDPGTGCFYGDCVLPVCLPKCQADSDCPDGRFCDPRYGECVDEDRDGSPLDAICDPEADPDECLGFCAGGGDTEARCLETCVLGVYPACGSESEDNGTADCLAPYAGADVGDLGFCVGLCDCSSDCADEAMVCISFESIEDFGATEVQGRPGFCAPMSDQVMPEQILACEE